MKAELKAELAAATNELDAARAELAASEESRANEVETRAAVEAELEGLHQQLTFAATTLDEERAAHDGTQRMLEEARRDDELRDSRGKPSIATGRRACAERSCERVTPSWRKAPRLERPWRRKLVGFRQL